MADSPVLYVYYRPDNDDAYPGVPARHITEADWAVFSIQQRRTVEEATTQEGYTRRKVWVHRDLVDETEQERAEREAAEQAARNAYERGQSLVRYREFEKVLPGPGEVIVGTASGPVAARFDPASAAEAVTMLDTQTTIRDRFAAPSTLAAHRPERGAPWTVWSGGAAITARGLEATYTGGTATFIGVHPNVGRDVEVRMPFTLGRIGGVGVVLRGTDINNYVYAWAVATTGSLNIYEMVSGTRHTRATGPNPNVQTGNTYTLIVRSFGNVVTAEIVGETFVQWEGSAGTGTTVGIRQEHVSGEGQNISREFTVRRIVSPAVPVLPTGTATNAPAPVTLPTMYGDTQGTHPSVLDFGATGWKGYRYWMAYTPYPNSNGQTENPTIVVSANGNTWVEPPGITNPLADAPPDGHHSDPELVFHDGTLYCFYRTSIPGATDGMRERIMLTSSTNGTTWSTPVLLFGSNSNARLLSPSVLYWRGGWHMWLVNGLDSPEGRLTHCTASSPFGPWSKPRECVMPSLPGRSLWHLGIRERSGQLHALISDMVRGGTPSGAEGRLHLAASYDGEHWAITPTPVLNRGTAGAWDAFKLYRATMTPTPSGWDVWYSAMSSDETTWKIGRTTLPLTY